MRIKAIDLDGIELEKRDRTRSWMTKKGKARVCRFCNRRPVKKKPDNPFHTKSGCDNDPKLHKYPYTPELILPIFRGNFVKILFLLK